MMGFFFAVSCIIGIVLCCFGGSGSAALDCLLAGADSAVELSISLAGAYLDFKTTGIDFSLTALFLTVFTEQWLETKDHAPALIGLGVSIVCRLLFGADSFLLPTMGGMLCCLLVLDARRTKKGGESV